MAGGKLTPRQKMINLMYLVFIAMLALNMSKEVLSAFGLMNLKFDSVNTTQTEQNKKLAMLLGQKAGESADFIDKNQKAIKIAEISKNFYEFLNNVKNEDILKDYPLENGVLPYEAMDKSNIDDKWFKGDKYSARGQEIMDKINGYKKSMIDALGNDVTYNSVKTKVNSLFNTDKVKNTEGVSINYLNYHFEGFPAIASVAKLTAMQNDIKSLENECYNIFLGAAYKEAASMKNYQAIVTLDKYVYFQGEQVKGKVVLGRYDENTKPTSFQGPGRLENGQAIISETAGSVGERNLSGKFTFLEDGKTIPLDFTGKYVVVPKPKSANIAADKMNVVYRGVENPMTISFSGISDGDVNASAPGLSKAGNGKYVMNPGQGSEVIINVTGKLSDGSTVSDKKAYRIKDIPPPTGTIGGDMGIVKGPKSRLENSTIGAIIPGFDFQVNLNVVSFALKVSGQPTVIVQGNRLSPAAKNVLTRAQKGDQVTISEINTKLVGSSLLLQKTNVVIFEIL
jgi:gliding motility-associated protein GldM